MTVSVVRFTVAGVPRDSGDPIADTSAGASGVGEGRAYVVVYDGHCTVCGRIVRMLRKWDANSRLLEIVPSQMPGLAERFPWIPPHAFAESVQVVRTGDGRTWERAAALEQLLDVLPKGGLLSWVFSIPFVRPLAERFYRWFARNRYRLGCGEHCTARPVVA